MNPIETRKPGIAQDNKPEIAHDRALQDGELDAVSGGVLSSAFSNTIKTLGEAMATMARKG